MLLNEAEISFFLFNKYSEILVSAIPAKVNGGNSSLKKKLHGHKKNNCENPFFRIFLMPDNLHDAIEAERYNVLRYVIRCPPIATYSMFLYSPWREDG